MTEIDSIYNQPCGVCGKRRTEHAHHLFSDTLLNRKLYKKLLDNPLNLFPVCSICHLWKPIPKDTEIEFCRKLKILPRSYDGLNIFKRLDPSEKWEIDEVVNSE